MTVPLFDSLTHPLLEGTWNGVASSFDLLASEMDASDVSRACAVGMPSIGGYAHEQFAAECSRDARLVPVAGVDPRELASRPTLIGDLKDLGFRAAKVHPRVVGMRLADPEMADLLAELERGDLPLFLCTYAHTPLDRWLDDDAYTALVRLLRRFPALRTVLVHGGDVNLLRYAELVRHNDNLLLDVSMTICKYEGSSIDLDLAFLFRSFDRRICVGSDFPEFSLRKLRERFDFFSEGLALDKSANIAHLNLSRWLGVEP